MRPGESQTRASRETLKRRLFLRLLTALIILGTSMTLVNLAPAPGQTTRVGDAPPPGKPNVNVSVAPPDSKNWSDSAKVAAGGFYSKAHQVDVLVKTTQPGTAVIVALQGGNGYKVPAEIDFDDGTVVFAGHHATLSTDDNGELTGKLTSSDVFETTTISAKVGESAPPSSAVVKFEWANHRRVDFDPPFVVGGNCSDQIDTFKHDSFPMDQHKIHYCVCQVKIVDENGNTYFLENTRENPHDLSMWESIKDPYDTTDGDGRATCSLCLASDSSVCSQTTECYDESVWATDDGPDAH